VNWAACHELKPTFFPKLELKNGNPEAYNTMVVIPALLPDEKRVKELLENLETHYLPTRMIICSLHWQVTIKDAESKECR
jgi:hypothetical protein